jgi:hypothetical protein
MPYFPSKLEHGLFGVATFARVAHQDAVPEMLEISRASDTGLNNENIPYRIMPLLVEMRNFHLLVDKSRRSSESLPCSQIRDYITSIEVTDYAAPGLSLIGGMDKRVDNIKVGRSI